MNPKSALIFLGKGSYSNASDIKKLLTIAKGQVTDGRYLIVVFESFDDWKNQIPIESLVILNTLGGIHTRSDKWEFFGNGAIRTYSGKSLRYKKTLQWIVVRRAGDKPYSRRRSFSARDLKQNRIPVSDKVFTRDVANNVWHLKDVNLKERVVSRFASLLTWNDEDFLVIEKGKSSPIKTRQQLSLDEDLVGVPTKEPYFWNNGSVLF